MDKQLIELIRTGLATAADLTAVGEEDIFAVKSQEPQLRFFAEKAFGVVAAERQVLGVPHSTEGVDRMGDIIRVKGWQLDAYKKNPVLLFGHNKDALPIAKALKVRKGQSSSGLKALLIDEKYHEADVNPQSELVWRMVESGALPGRSVGFLPIEAHMPETEEEREKLGLGKWGIEFRKQELLESSIVPVPANAEALQGKCYAIAQATAKQAVEDGVATWADVQCLAGVLPITDLDASRIEREQRRSHVAFPEGTAPPMDNGVCVPEGTVMYIDSTGNDAGWQSGTYAYEDGTWTLSIDDNQLALGADERSALTAVIADLSDDIATLREERAQLREQVADLTRGIAALARATEDRSEDAEVNDLERSSHDEPSESFYDTLFAKVEERRQRKRFSEELAARLGTRLTSGNSPEE